MRSYGWKGGGRGGRGGGGGRWVEEGEMGRKGWRREGGRSVRDGDILIYNVCYMAIIQILLLSVCHDLPSLRLLDKTALDKTASSPQEKEPHFCGALSRFPLICVKR